MIEWQWHQLNHMQAICTSLQKITTPAPASVRFLRVECPSWHPTNSVKALKSYLDTEKYGLALVDALYVVLWLIRLRRLWLPSDWRRRRVLWLQVSSAGRATWNASWGPRLTRRPTTQTTSMTAFSLELPHSVYCCLWYLLVKFNVSSCFTAVSLFITYIHHPGGHFSQQTLVIGMSLNTLPLSVLDGKWTFG